MRPIAAAALVLTVLAACSSQAQPSCGGYAFYSTHKPDGTKIGLFVTDEQVKRLATWDPASGEPPLSVGAAIARATSWAEANWKQFDGFRVDSAQLSRVGCAYQQDKWVYVVSFSPMANGYPVMAQEFFLGVLTDGTILPPRTDK